MGDAQGILPELDSGIAGPPSDIAALDAALGNSDYHRDPYTVLSRIREVAPVYRSEVLNGWLISRFHDVETVLRDTEHFSNKMFGQMVKRSPETRELVELIENNMIGSLDPPDHTRLRRIFTVGIFNSERLAKLRATVVEIVNDVMNRVETGKSMDVLTDLTQPVAFGFLTRFLGVPAAEAEKFFGWSHDIAQFMIQPHADEAAVRRGVEAFAEIRAYVDAQIEQRISQGSTDDVFGLLATARDREGLSLDEITATAMQLVFAGAGTSSNGLANTIYLLLRNPDQFEALRADPGLIQAAIHEGLRCESPVFFTFRLVKTDVTFQGITIPAGETVIVNLGGANRDPDRFPNPERFDISRPRAAHLAFGFGPHLCLGERLARLQAEVVLQELLRRFPNLHLSGPEPQWNKLFGLRELKALPVSW